MDTWEIFENDCVKFLNSNFGNSTVEFIGKGKSDSTTSDIEVRINNKPAFLIEVKMSKAQSGQFVLLIEGNKFIYSPKNKTSENYYTNLIKNFINTNFDFYKNVSTAALGINLPKSYFAQWIKGHYINKGVKYVITAYNKKFVVLPINKYDDYFDVSGNIRRKDSGSNELPKKYINNVKEYFKIEYPNPVYFTEKGKKVFLQSNDELNGYQFSTSGIKCQLTFNKNERKYEVRKLGWRTSNPTVIFSIKCVKPQDKSDLTLFINSLR